jgi:hypothetical protein
MRDNRRKNMNNKERRDSSYTSKNNHDEWIKK